MNTVIDPTQAAQAKSSRAAGQAACCAAAAVVIGHALSLTGGTFRWDAIYWLTAGFILAWGGVLFASGSAWATLGICVAGFLWEIRQLNRGSLPMIDVPLWQYHAICMPCMALAGLAAICGRARIRRIGLPVLVLTYLTTGGLVLHAAPRPFIDVYEVTQDSCDALIHGHNPYAIDFPDIYASRPDWEKSFYSPGMVVNGRVQLGFPYMPLGLAVDEIGYLVCHDYRYGNLLAIAAAGLLLGYAERSWAAPSAAAILLATPQGFFVLFQGWADPAIVVMLAATVFCAVRGLQILPWIFGLLMASKQHMFLAAPAALLLMPRPWKFWPTARFFAKAAIAASVVTLPLMLWNFHAFWHSAVGVQFSNPFRYDALTYSAAWASLGHTPPSSAIAFLGAILAAVLAVWRTTRTPAGFAAAVAVTYLTLFVLSKQAFCNYYFLTIGMLCCSLAAWEIP